MKTILFLTVFFLSINNLFSQEVIATGGDYYGNSNISVSWTIGEPVTETINNGTNILTQGFQQSKLTASEIFSLKQEKINISVFPNPSNDFINLKTDDFKDLKYQFSDINGKLISEKILNSDITEINTKNLSSSIYFLKILRNNKLIKTFKIIKQ